VMPRSSEAPPSRTRTVSGELALGELALIEAIRQRAARIATGTRALRIGIGDDCAVLRPKPGHEICVTTDFSLENTHFRRDWHPPQSAGHRCLARGLSDLAAMGAKPLAVFLSLALPPRTPAAWVDGFLDGLTALAEKVRVPLAGGDTAQSQELIAADIVAIGQVPRGQARLRSGAQPGDALYVTGALGGAAAELLALSQNPRKFRRLTASALAHPHLYPDPRLAAGRRLRKLAHAGIDLSDGLSTDLAHLCQASNLAAVIEETALPIHSLALAAEHAGATPSALELALHGGEDYEILFTAAARVRIPRRIAGVPIHRIGTMRSRRPHQPQVILRTMDGRETTLAASGWEHFKAK
jgi:thiamine-monophosphate kinase